MKDPMLVADCVTRSFGTTRVLSAGSLRAVAGEVRVMFGRNGAGKSTLLRIAAGVITPDSGALRLHDEAFESWSPDFLARLGVFYLPDHDVLSRSFTIRRQLELFRARYDGLSVEEAAGQVCITQHLDKRPTEVSAGERRRAEFAAALVRRPVCLLADEPFRNISPLDCEVVAGVIRGMADAGCAVVVTGHEVATLMDAADHVTWCTSGTTYELGPPAAAMKHDVFQREYLMSRTRVRD